jgi:hypothetical protein
LAVVNVNSTLQYHPLGSEVFSDRKRPNFGTDSAILSDEGRLQLRRLHPGFLHSMDVSLHRRQATSPSIAVPFDAGVIKVGL